MSPQTLRRLAAPLAAGLLAGAAPVRAPGPDAAPSDRPLAHYQLALIRRGPAWTPGRTPAVDSLQAGHMANIRRLSEARRLATAGPFADGGELRGIYLFRADSAEAARFAAEDPAVRAGRLVLEFLPLTAPAGIGEPYFRLRESNPRAADSMTTRALGFVERAEPAVALDAAALRELEASHAAHVRRGEREGAVLFAGTVRSAAPLRGLIVFRGDSTVARAWAAGDPLLARGAARLRLLAWFSPAHLLEPAAGVGP